MSCAKLAQKHDCTDTKRAAALQLILMSNNNCNGTLLCTVAAAAVLCVVSQAQRSSPSWTLKSTISNNIRHCLRAENWGTARFSGYVINLRLTSESNCRLSRYLTPREEKQFYYFESE